MDKELEKALADIGSKIPASVDWGVALSVFIMRELDTRHPGFKDTIRQRVLDSAEKTEGDNPQETAELRQSLLDLANGWIFER